MPIHQQKITAEALLELRMASDARVAPDGERVAFCITESNVETNRVTQHLYAASLSSDTPIRQLTHGQAEESEPRWSPDGQWLAFLTARPAPEASDDAADDDEEPKEQVWLLPMDGQGGEAEKLTDAPEGISAYEWLPDSSGIIYLAQEPRAAPLQAAREERVSRKDDANSLREEKFRQQIWQISQTEKKPRLLHSGDFGIGEIAVSPEGLRVAFTTNYTGEDNDYHLADLWVLEIKTGEARALTGGAGYKTHPLWLPSGEALLFTQTLNPALSFSQEHLYEVTLSDQQVRHLTASFPHELTGWQNVCVSQNGDIFLTAAVGTKTLLYRKTVYEDLFSRITLDLPTVHGFHVSPNGVLVFIASGAADPPEVYFLNSHNQHAIALTDLNKEWAEKYEICHTTVINYLTPTAETIEALLTLPVGYEEEKRTLPLILNLHGGPHGRNSDSLTPFSMPLLWAAEGYAVLSPNYRGSEGYGETFGTANVSDLGGRDLEDVMLGVEWAINEKIADPQRIGVIGSSYGAFLAHWAIARSPRFRAAVSEFGIASLATDFSNSQSPRWNTEYLGGAPWDVPERYAAQSPLSEVQKINTPLLILHGEGDENTSLANSKELYQALRLLGQTVEFVRFPREGHGFFEPLHRLDEMRRIVNWFARYLEKPGETRIARVGERVVHDGWELCVTRAAIGSYRGSETKRGQYLEVVVALRDLWEKRREITISSRDLVLIDLSNQRELAPVGVPVESLGGKSLARGRGWKFIFLPSPDIPGIAISFAVTFKTPAKATDFHLRILDFPPVLLTAPSAK